MRAFTALPPFVLARQAALLSQDWVSLERLLDPTLQYVHATGVRHDKPAYLAFARERVRVEAMQLEDAQVQVIGNVSLVTGRLRQTIVRNGETASVVVVSWVTEVWRANGDWQLVAFQSTRATE